MGKANSTWGKITTKQGAWSDIGLKPVVPLAQIGSEEIIQSYRLYRIAKELNPDKLLLVKTQTYYIAYGTDAQALSKVTNKSCRQMLDKGIPIEYAIVHSSAYDKVGKLLYEAGYRMFCVSVKEV